MESHILSYLNYWEPLGYIIVFLGMMFEGDTFLFIASFLAHQGIFQPIPLFVTALWGMVLGDNLWYSLGFKLRNSDSKLVRWAEKATGPFDEHLKNNPLRTIFIAKFTYGINHAIILRAGTLKIKWKDLEKSDILATILWIVIVGALGYFSGASFGYVKHYLRYGEIAILIGLIIFLGLEYFITKKTKRKL